MTDRGFESYSHDGPECPRCAFTFTPDEPHYYDEARYTEDECQECGCKFTVSVAITTSWSCEEIVAAHGEGSEKTK